MLEEKNSDGSWSDYIFANGQRIAQADSYDERIHMEGTSTVAGAYAAWYVPFPSYTIKAGDKISWRQYQAGAVGGIGISFGGGGSTNWTTTDTDGQVMNSDNTQNQWHFRTVDLSSFAGKAVANVWIAADAATPMGSWNGWFSDIAVYSADGTVTPIYNREPGEGLSYFSGGGETTGAQAFVERSNTQDDAATPGNTTTYYVGDQLGSTRMLLAAGGWPLSSDTYYPYGTEASPSADANHYKFTGKERDIESGNDYFLARYYSSNIGRFLSPDWSKNPQGVPYADFTNPRSLNLYGYMRNNPLSGEDPDGHCSAAEMAICAKMTQDMAGGMDSSTAAQEGAQMQDQQQSSTSAANANPNAAAEQHQYNMVVRRTNNLLGTDDAAGHLKPNGKLIGGNYEFPINDNTSDAAFRKSLNRAFGEAYGDKGYYRGHGFLGLESPSHRIGFSPSLHHDGDALHVDHFNGGSFPFGTLLHGLVDAGIGHLPYYGSNHAFSYAGIQ